MKAVAFNDDSRMVNTNSAATTPAPAQTFRKLPSKRSFEDVIEQIRSRIKTGALREGDRLPPERELAEQLGVSRNTVREALRSLENSGVVRLKKGPGGGAFIHSGSRDAVAHAMADLYRLGNASPVSLTEARLILGPPVARLACMRWDDADMAALEDNVRRTREANERGDHHSRAEHNVEFHQLLVQASKNPILIAITHALVEMVREFLQVFGAMPNEYALASRERMLEHLRKRDAEAAAQEMAAYLEWTQNIYFERMGKAVASPSDQATR